jgi:hypothetical protein
VSSAGRELAVFNRLHMAPGEMEHIRLDRELLKAAEGEITLCAGEKP